MGTFVRCAAAIPTPETIEAARALDAAIGALPGEAEVLVAVRELAPRDESYAAALWARYVARMCAPELGAIRPYAPGDVSRRVLRPLGIDPRLQARYQRPALRRLFPRIEMTLDDDGRLAELLVLEAGMKRGRPIEECLREVCLAQVKRGLFDARSAFDESAIAATKETVRHRERERAWLVAMIEIHAERWQAAPWREMWTRALEESGLRQPPTSLGHTGRAQLLDLVFAGSTVEDALTGAFLAEADEASRSTARQSTRTAHRG